MSNQLEYTAAVTGFDKVETALKNQAKGLQLVSTAATKYDASLKQTSSASNTATQSIGNLSRVVQDAPFGFIAISNNINPLLESFQRLKVETGSSKDAFKALGSSLTGAGGIGLAVGLVTSLLVVFGDKLFASNKALEATNLQLVEFERVANNAKDSLKDFNKEAEGLLKLNAANITERFGSGFDAQFLNAQAKFVKISEELAAAQEQVPILYENSSRAYKYFLDNATRSTREFVGQFGDLASIPDALLSKLPDSQQALVKAAQEASKALTETQNRVKELTLERETQAAINRSLTAEEKRRLEKEAEGQRKRAKAIKTVASTLEELEKQIDFLNRKEVLLNISQIEEKKNALKSTIDTLLRDFNLEPGDTILAKLVGFNQFSKIPGLRGLELRTAVRESLKQQFDGNINLPETIKLTGIKFDIPLPKQLIDDKKLEELTEALASQFEQISENVAFAFGESLGKALSGKVSFGEFFESIFRQVGLGMKELGRILIKFAIEVAAVKKFAAANPALAIAAGIALVALGSTLEAKLNKQAFATGTRFAPGGLALVGERGPELMSVPRGAQITPAAQTANLLGGMGGAFIAETRVAGSDLLLVLKRAEKSYSRTA